MTTQLKILIIDDNEIDRFVHKKLLALHKISDEIVECNSGKAALKYLNEVEPNSIPNVILLDVMMPEMDGFDFLVHYERLHKKFDKKPIVFMLSSTEDEDDIRRVRQNELVQHLLKKPFSPAAFQRAIEKAQNSDLK